MIFLRADGNHILGTGHLMRCMSVAAALKENGIAVKFVLADKVSEEFVNSRGFETLILDTDYTNLEDELPKFKSFILKYKPSCIVIDSYYVTKNYLNELKTITKTAYIDDLAAFAYPVDTLINYNVYAEDMDYEILYKGKPPKCCRGTEYAPLRKDFEALAPALIKEKALNVLVLTGGADSLHVALNFAKEICEHPDDLHYTFVVGAFSEDLKQIKHLTKGNKNIEIHQNVTDMKGLMLKSDLSVTAAGSTQYELCACGIPSINYVLADNQILGALGFFKRSIMEYAGDVRKDKDFYRTLHEKTIALSLDKLKREIMSKKAKALVDGRGAKRIAKVISE